MQTASVTSSYVHVQRSLDLMGGFYSGPTTPQGDNISRGAFFSNITQSVVSWLAANRVRTLGQLLAASEIQVGSVFSHTGAFFCRGMSAYLQGRRHALPDAYAKLDDFSAGLRLVATINPDHLTSNSASDHVSGQRRLFFVGIVMGVSEKIIEARPVIIGLVIPNTFGEDIDLGFPAFLTTGEVFLSQLDAFSTAATSLPATAAELEKVQQIRETEVKQAFAAIIGEPFVPIDRADEMSDLTTTNLSVEGKPVFSAFAFKGRARAHPLTVADMGKNGDQIFRLFNEPADLVVVQHCHQITSAIRAHMRAFATQPGRGRMFALIDGADTCRIMRTYGKLGF